MPDTKKREKKKLVPFPLISLMSKGIKNIMEITLKDFQRLTKKGLSNPWVIKEKSVLFLLKFERQKFQIHYRKISKGVTVSLFFSLRKVADGHIGRKYHLLDNMMK